MANILGMFLSYTGAGISIYAISELIQLGIAIAKIKSNSDEDENDSYSSDPNNPEKELNPKIRKVILITPSEEIKAPKSEEEFSDLYTIIVKGKDLVPNKVKFFLVRSKDLKFNLINIEKDILTEEGRIVSFKLNKLVKAGDQFNIYPFYNDLILSKKGQKKIFTVREENNKHNNLTTEETENLTEPEEIVSRPNEVLEKDISKSIINIIRKLEIISSQKTKEHFIESYIVQITNQNINEELIKTLQKIIDNHEKLNSEEIITNLNTLHSRIQNLIETFATLFPYKIKSSDIKRSISVNEQMKKNNLLFSEKIMREFKFINDILSRISLNKPEPITTEKIELNEVNSMEENRTEITRDNQVTKVERNIEEINNHIRSIHKTIRIRNRTIRSAILKSQTIIRKLNQIITILYPLKTEDFSNEEKEKIIRLDFVIANLIQKFEYDEIYQKIESLKIPPEEKEKIVRYITNCINEIKNLERINTDLPNNQFVITIIDKISTIANQILKIETTIRSISLIKHESHKKTTDELERIATIVKKLSEDLAIYVSSKEIYKYGKIASASKKGAEFNQAITVQYKSKLRDFNKLKKTLKISNLKRNEINSIIEDKINQLDDNKDKETLRMILRELSASAVQFKQLLEYLHPRIIEEIENK